MTIPDRTGAAELLASLEPAPTLFRHMAAVAEVAGFLAARAAARGVVVDRALVESAALLHDLDKALPDDDPLRALGHGHAGAAWLDRRGLGELAAAVAGHPVIRLADPGADRWLERSTLEERIVAYADKRAMQRVGSLDARFARWHTHHPERIHSLAVARGRVERLERDVCDLADVDPSEIRRLRWVRVASEQAGAACGPPSAVAGRTTGTDGSGTTGSHRVPGT
jgi:putative nucleotidyltransferase with HDIG domain